MLAIVKRVYGGPEVLSIQEMPIPLAQEDEVLIKVKANSANPADWHILRGKPYFARLSFGLFKPKDPILGSDFAGIVEAKGSKVENLNIGDRVYGENMGNAFAEYLVAKENILAKMPIGSSFKEMAGLPIAGLTAWQALMEHGKMQKGERIIINGASGGVGHFAVQIAKAHGAIVTGICSAKNRDFVLSLGADEVLAYDENDLQNFQDQNDLILDCHGNLNHSDLKGLAKRAVLIGFTGMGHMMKVLISNMFSKYSLKQFTAAANSEDLESLARMVEHGDLKTRIHKIYPADQIPKAIAFIEKMRTPGKVVMSWEQ